MSELRQAVAESYRSIPLPEGWQVKDFADVVFLQEGPGIRKYEYAEDGYPMINVRCVQDGYIDMSSSKCANLELATNKWKHFQIDEGDILFTISGTIGRSAIVLKSDLPLLMNTSVVRFKSLDKDLDVKFLYHTVRSHDFIKSLKDQATGTAIKNVGPSHLKKLQISYPPLEKQKQIVAVLDKAFAAIDVAKANIEKNLQNAKELFQSKLNQIFTQKGGSQSLSMGDGWEEKKLADICGITSKLIDPREGKHLNLLHVGGANITSETGELIKLKTSKEEALISGKFIFDDSMVLYSKIRPYLVKVCRPDFTGLCSADIYPLLPNEEVIKKDFLYYLLVSKKFTDYAMMGSARAGMPKVNRKHLFNFDCIIPSIAKQSENIKLLNELQYNVRLLEINNQARLNELSELKKSILQKAFSGELI